jgi:CRP-like cAMP-binding protein
VGESFFQALREADRSRLIDATRAVSVAAQRTLFRQGEPGDSFAVLISGRVKVIARSESGRSVLVGMRGAGELVGELAVLDDEPRSADVVTVDDVEVRIGTAQAFRRCVLESPSAAEVLCRTLVSRLRESDGGRVEMASLDGHARVALRLLDLATSYGTPDGSGVQIELPITQDELADWIGASRPAVARALADFRAAGFVTTGRRALSVTDEPGLRAYVAERLI